MNCSAIPPATGYNEPHLTVCTPLTNESFHFFKAARSGCIVHVTICERMSIHVCARVSVHDDACELCAPDSPHDDNDKVQHVPAVADVGVLVHDQTVGHDLQERLNGEDDEEGILHCLLHTHTHTEGGHSGHVVPLWLKNIQYV